MRIQPRQQILDVLRAVAKYSRCPDGWVWDGRDGRNSISDAEQLLCLLYPAAEVTYIRLDSPDDTSDDVLAALTPMGDSIQIPALIIDVISDYMASYTDDEGTPIFSGESYFAPIDSDDKLTDEQRRLDVVDSFATSISLALSTLGFLKIFNRSVRRQEMKGKIARLEAATSTRLTAAMVGLLRSFSVNVFEASAPEGRSMVRTLNQSHLPDRVVLENLRQRLQPVRASIRDATLGLSQDIVAALDNENMLFECGWSWGVVREAPVVETDEPIGKQLTGVALGAPYLYFTEVALDAIANLFSERSRVLGLLNPEQQRLAQALQLRWDLTLSYWFNLATFGSGRWPVEDIPWRAIDDEESEYFSLVVTGFVLQELLTHGGTDNDLARTVDVLAELANRGRVNRRFTRDDPAIGLHMPGVRLDLSGPEVYGPPTCWVVSDYTPLLLKRSLRAAGLARSIVARDRLLTIADEALDHMWDRRLATGAAAGLWDDPSSLTHGTPSDELRPSWYATERMIECLVTAVNTIERPPVRSTQLIELTTDLLSEADHLFSQYQMGVSFVGGSALDATMLRIDSKLQRARQLLYDKPGTANALLMDALRELDELAVAREDVARSV